MSDPNLERPPKRALIRRKEKDQEESKTMLAIIMGGIAALFVFSIVMAFNYASHTVKPETAASKQTPAASAPATTGSGASTTGSGGNRS
ncbi:MAG: hypothetical protein AB1490_20065 [Pseudomonadota bacterium]